jgi:hypothetical protein
MLAQKQVESDWKFSLVKLNSYVLQTFAAEYLHELL